MGLRDAGKCRDYDYADRGRLRHNLVRRPLRIARLGFRRGRSHAALSDKKCADRKDRLAAFFHWNDTMALEQALLVAKEQRVDIADLRRWANLEGQIDKMTVFEAALAQG